MEKIAVDGPKMPIGFLSSLWKGIEHVNAHPGVLILPVVLDLFLWFGPHLSVFTLIQPVIDAQSSALASQPDGQAFIDGLTEQGERFNLFSMLAAAPLFPPSLMAGVNPRNTPLGSPAVVSVTQLPAGLVLAGGFFLLSLLLGSAYWVLVGRVIQGKPWTFRDSLGRWVRTAAVMILAAVSLAVLVLVAFIPAAMVLYFLNLLSPTMSLILGQFFLFLVGSLVFWAFFFLMFSIHGVILYRDDIPAAVSNSVSTSRWLYPVSIWIPILLVALYILTMRVWMLASEGSWTGAMGILGSAYTNSVIVAASMAYYVDKRRWIAEVRTYLQSRGAGTLPPTGA
jgi:hypothetical protein